MNNFEEKNNYLIKEYKKFLSYININPRLNNKNIPNLDVFKRYLDLRKQDANTLHPLEKFKNDLSKIDPRLSVSTYDNEYDKYLSNKKEFFDEQLQLYKYLIENNPNVRLFMRARVKSKQSTFNKYTEKLEKLKQDNKIDEEIRTLPAKDVGKIYDIYGATIYISSYNYKVDNVFIEDGKIKIISNREILDSNSLDVIEFNGKKLKLAPSLFEKHEDVVFYKYLAPDTQEIAELININSLKNSILVRSDKQTLEELCFKINNQIITYFKEQDFKIFKKRDYISEPKLTGYQALQFSTNNPTKNMIGKPSHFEVQIKTVDMNTQATEERNTYKPKELDINTYYNLPGAYALYNILEGKPNYYEPTIQEIFNSEYNMYEINSDKPRKPCISYDAFVFFEDFRIARLKELENNKSNNFIAKD